MGYCLKKSEELQGNIQAFYRGGLLRSIYLLQCNAGAFAGAHGKDCNCVPGLEGADSLVRLTLF